MIIAIIPARKGSKRIKNKNIKKINGKPIIGIVIKKLVKMSFFDHIIVSTDSKRYEKISYKYGANIVLSRNKKLSADNIGINQVVCDVLNKLKLKKIYPKLIVCIYPTSIFIDKKKIVDGINLFKNKKFNFVISATNFSHPIQRSFTIRNYSIKKNFKGFENIQTQKIEKNYFDAAQFYIGNLNSWTNYRTVFTGNTGAIELSKDQCQDIDEITDWKLAEMVYKKNQKKYN
jgi:N-acylneuraminate cytidylyltransferase